MRSASCLLGVAWLIAVGPGVARAEDPPSTAFRAVIDRVDLEPAAVGGLRLRIGLSALTLQGQVIPLVGERSIQATISGSKLDAPFAIGRYDATDPYTAIVIAIQANLAFTDVLPNVLVALEDAVLAKLNDRPDRTLLAILAYGESTATEKKLISLKATRGKLAQVSSDGSSGEPALVDTLEGALRLLKRAKTSPEGAPLRKMIVVISDGRDRSGDRDRVTALGERAGRDGVRIHTFGYAPSKVLRPLLTLGELSKRSLGTFRWVRTGGTESWAPAFQQLHDEIARQYVVTYFVAGDAAISGKRIKVKLTGRVETTSNETKVPDPRCGTDACNDGYCASGVCAIPRQEPSRGVLGWLAWLIGVGLVAVVALGVIGFLLQRRQHAAASGAGGLPGQPLAPGARAAAVKQAKQAKGSKPRANQPAAVAPAAGGPALLILSGPRAGERIALHHGFTIGKAPTSSLVIDDGYASTQHAQVVIDTTGSCRLYDLRSTNGTFANGVHVTDVVLDHGMMIRIGSTELRFLAH
jgi:hypothetical protein